MDRAKSQASSAVRRLPRCRSPDGLGANRPAPGWAGSLIVIADHHADPSPRDCAASVITSFGSRRSHDWRSQRANWRRYRAEGHGRHRIPNCFHRFQHTCPEESGRAQNSAEHHHCDCPGRRAGNNPAGDGLDTTIADLLPVRGRLSCVTAFRRRSPSTRPDTAMRTFCTGKLSRSDPPCSLVKIGCPGETTGSMLDGPPAQEFCKAFNGGAGRPAAWTAEDLRSDRAPATDRHLPDHRHRGRNDNPALHHGRSCTR